MRRLTGIARWQTDIMLSDDITILSIIAAPPVPPSQFMKLNQKPSSNSVDLTLDWTIPTDTGGRDDLSYRVTISPPAQLSATTVTSTSVTVSAADYNVVYTLSVVATNCVGMSIAGNYTFTVGM